MSGISGVYYESQAYFCAIIDIFYVGQINLNHFTGNLENETDVLDWMIDQKSDESIEEITRETLFEYIGSKDFLAVLFCGFLEFYYR